MNTYIDSYGVTFSENRKILLQGNADLEQYVIPKGTEVIGEDSWGKMKKLQSIIIREGGACHRKSSIFGSLGLTKIELPSSIREIGSDAFELTMLRFVQIPEGITVLRNDVFCDCFALGAVVLPSTLEAIEEFAFCCCPAGVHLSRNMKEKQILKGTCFRS